MSRLAFVTAGIVWLSWSALLCAEQPLYEEDPYDQITLDAFNNNEIVKIVPLDLPNRQPPPRGKPGDKLVIRRVESPDKEYTVQWRSIAKLELFEQLVLNKANELVADKRFEEAFDYFSYLERSKLDATELNKAIENSLYEEAKHCHLKKEFDGALALLQELHSRNARRPGLDVALGRTTNELVKCCVEEKNYDAARALLRNLSAEYSDHPVVKEWRDRLAKQAAPLFDEARTAADAGQWSKAGELTRQIAKIWPDLPDARKLAKTVHQKYPRVVVGVGVLPSDSAPDRFDDWAMRRTSRLLYRTLTEFAGASTEGGKYDCPVGEMFLGSLNRRLTIKLKPGIGWAEGNATLSNSDVARRLLAMAKPTDPAYRVDWADLLLAVSTRGVYDIEVEFRRPHVRPEAMLQIMLTPHGAATEPGKTPPVNGPFVTVSRTPQEVIVTASPQYFAAKAGGPKEIVERRYPTVAKAIAALKRGDIDVLDRVNPWNIAALRSETHLVVQPYALPLVHCLIPNMRRPLLSDRTFRRALAYGITRELILQQMLGGEGVVVPGCKVTSSPFPLGIDPADPMGYASDDAIEPRPYEPRLAIALAGVALKSYIDAQKSQGHVVTKLPTLVLAHPSDEIATAACASIKLQLDRLKIPVELRVINGSMPAKVPEDVDLLYAELPMCEPLVDARRVLGEEGMSGGCSPYMTLALRQLDEAVDWSQVRDCLHRVHRIAYDDAAILPLWQLVEYFVYHDSLRGIATKPVSLYQNVELWRPPFQYPAE